jgi:hypothetical protein
LHFHILRLGVPEVGVKWPGTVVCLTPPPPLLAWRLR